MDHRIDVRLREYALTALLVLEGLVLFVAAPLAAMGMRAPITIGGLFLTPLLGAIVIISSSVGARLLGGVAILSGVAGVLFRLNHSSPVTVWTGHLAVIAAILAVSLVIGKAVFAPGRITHHRLEGAVILYLNVAIVFASSYRLIAELDPAAFAVTTQPRTEAAAVAAALYFSFSTLTSTGFGEILPVNPIARSMANLEAVMGQLYLAILLARLVTMNIDAKRY